VSCNGRHWYILCMLGLSYGHLVYFMVIWYIFPVLVFCTTKIWQPCPRVRFLKQNSGTELANPVRSVRWKKGYNNLLNITISITLLRFARWYICIQKIQIWVYFGGPRNGKGSYVYDISWQFGIYHGNTIYFPVLVCRTTKNLATLSLGVNSI
jgi:hypothetical protein